MILKVVFRKLEIKLTIMNLQVITEYLIVALMLCVPVRSSWCTSEFHNISGCLVQESSSSDGEACLVPVEDPFSLDVWAHMSLSDPENIVVLRIQEVGNYGKRAQNLDFHVEEDVRGKRWHHVLVRSEKRRGADVGLSYIVYLDSTEIANGSVDFVRAKFMIWVKGSVFLTEERKCVFELEQDPEKLVSVFATNDTVI